MEEYKNRSKDLLEPFHMSKKNKRLYSIQEKIDICNRVILNNENKWHVCVMYGINNNTLKLYLGQIDQLNEKLIDVKKRDARDYSYEDTLDILLEYSQGRSLSFFNDKYNLTINTILKWKEKNKNDYYLSKLNKKPIFSDVALCKRDMINPNSIVLGLQDTKHKNRNWFTEFIHLVVDSYKDIFINKKETQQIISACIIKCITEHLNYDIYLNDERKDEYFCLNKLISYYKIVVMLSNARRLSSPSFKLERNELQKLRYARIKSIRECNTIDGFRLMLKRYNNKGAWQITRKNKKIYDPVVENFRKDYGYRAIIQIIYHKKIKSSEIRFDLPEDDYEKMVEQIWKKENCCEYCKSSIDLFRSGRCTNIEKDRIRTDLPYFHKDQILACTCTFCNSFFGDLSCDQRNDLITECRNNNTHNGILDFSNKCNELDFIRKEYENCASNDSGKLKNNCIPEIDEYIKLHSKTIHVKFCGMCKRKHEVEFKSADDVTEIIRAFGGTCCVSGISVSKENVNVSIDRITDSNIYAKDEVWVLYKGVNNGKSCNSQGTNNNIFQNKDSFNKFVREHGKKYGLDEANDFNDNVIKYLRYFFHNLVSNCEKF